MYEGQNAAVARITFLKNQIHRVYIYIDRITYIERQNAKCIVFLNIARGTELVKRALSHPETEMLPMFTGRMQSASCFSMFPEAPNL
jgi:hypothetical protein